MNILLKTMLEKTISMDTAMLLKEKKQPEKISNYRMAKGYWLLKVRIIRMLKNWFFITLGVFLAAFGFKGFLLTNHFIDGGATGISLLLSEVSGVELSVFIIAVNIPFILLGYVTVGLRFAIKTCIAISLLAIVLYFVEFPNVTNDNLLVALFGGFFLGAGIGMSVRGGAVIDGTEVLAIYLSRKLKTSIGDIIILINVIIFSVAAYLLSVEIALYSMVTYLSASKTLDFIVEGIEEYMGITIVTSKIEEVRTMIISKMGRGVTIYKGKGGYSRDGFQKEMDILYTIMTRLELNRFYTEIEKIDTNAFVVMNSVKEIKGGTIKKRPFQH